MTIAGIGAPLLVVVLGSSWGGWSYWSRRQPGYALAQTVEAVEHQDVGAFQRYVDLDGVCYLAASDLIGKLRNNEPNRQLSGLEVATAELVKLRVVEECRRRVRAAIENGMPSKERLETAKRMKVTRVEHDGQSATVHVYVMPPGRAPSMMRLRMRDLGEHWQVAEILDVQELAGEPSARR